MKQPIVYVIAGEPSGDLLGARLIDVLKQRRPDLVFKGVGGPRMQAAGLATLFPQSDLAVFGLWEILPKLAQIMKRINRTVAAVLADQPAVVVTIDSPDFCFRVAKKIRAQNSKLPLVHYVAPSVWAWRPGRAKKIAGFLSHLLALFDFEPPYFTKEKLPCTFVGHPVIENGVEQGDAARFRAAHNLAADVTVLTVLPGSRGSEVKHLLPIFKEVVARAASHGGPLVVAMPTVETVAVSLAQHTGQWPVPVIITHSDRDKYDAFAASRAALCASGTVNLEVGLARLPMVVAYKISAVTALLYRALIKIRLFSPVNILLQHQVVPECIQENCTVDAIYAHLRPLLLSESPERTEQLLQLPALRAHLQNGETSPSARAASVVQSYLP